MSVKKRVYTETTPDGKTRTRTVWRARVWTYPPHGPRREVEEEFTTKSKAEDWERKQRQSSRGRSLDLERTTLADAGLWERAEPILRRRLAPKTFDYYRHGWNLRVLPTFGQMKVGRISVGDVERAQAQWAKESSVHTARQARYALSAALRVAVKDGLLPANPARTAESSKSEKRRRHERKVGQTLTPAQLDDLVHAVLVDTGETYARMVDLMGSAGLRYGEAAALQVADIDFGRRVIEVRRSVTEVTKDDGEDLPPEYWREGNLVWGPPKGGKSRVVPLPEHLEEPLRALVAGERRTAQVFRSERTNYVIRNNVLKRRTDWHKLVAGLGFAGFRVHDLRATAATNYLSAGVPAHVVRDIMGHTDLRVTNGYARPHDDALTLAAAALRTYSGRRS
jgi:integrase